MSKLAEKSAMAQHGLEVVEGALDRTQSALHAAERADNAAAAVRGKSRTLLKVFLVVTILGIIVVVAKKMMDRDSKSSGSGGFSGNSNPGEGSSGRP